MGVSRQLEAEQPKVRWFEAAPVFPENPASPRRLLITAFYGAECRRQTLAVVGILYPAERPCSEAAETLKEVPMPKYVIEREIPGAGRMTDAELHQAVLKSIGVLRDLGPQIQWLHSYVTDDSIRHNSHFVQFGPERRHHRMSAGRKP